MFGVDPGGSRRIEPAHVGRAAGVWVVTYKKRSGGPYASYDDVVEEALCFGWIDSVRRSLDADRSQLLVTPRNHGSRWFKGNKQRIQRLTAAGRLAPAGLAAVTDAKADGSWTALDAVEELVEPEDLGAALDAEPDARANWDGFQGSTKRAILEWIIAAKRPPTRASRVAETARLAAQGIRANQAAPSFNFPIRLQAMATAQRSTREL
jgi:uncharacterized protein YdeI (YjbR/CyaY-like superfamily)